MSAGDLKIVGWFGDGGDQYKAIEAPSVEYVPTTVNGIKSIKKALDVGYVVPTYLKQTVIQGLQVDNVSVSVDAPNDKSGTMAAISYGGGWTLVRLSTPQFDEANSRLNIHYEKEITIEFEIGLPTGLTMTGALGVGYIKYLGNTLLEFDTGDTNGSNEWGHSPFASFVNTTYKQYGSSSEKGSLTEHIAVYNDVMSCAITFNGKTLKKITTSLEDYRALDLVVSTFYNNHFTSYIVRDEDGNITSSGTSSTTTVDYEYVDLNGIYKGLRWNKTGNVITLKFWEITLFEWDVTGLT